MEIFHGSLLLEYGYGCDAMERVGSESRRAMETLTSDMILGQSKALVE